MGRGLERELVPRSFGHLHFVEGLKEVAVAPYSRLVRSRVSDAIDHPHQVLSDMGRLAVYRQLRFSVAASLHQIVDVRGRVLVWHRFLVQLAHVHCASPLGLAVSSWGLGHEHQGGGPRAVTPADHALRQHLVQLITHCR